MNTHQPLAAVSVGLATVANLAASMSVEKWSAVAAILAAVLSAAVSIKNLRKK